MYITGGRESSPLISIVESNYYGREPGEVLLNISGPISVETLKAALEWFEEQTITIGGITKLREHLEAGDLPKCLV